MAIDPNWVRENPEEAARQIELLTKERDQYRAAEEKQIALREKAAQRVEELECQVEEAGRRLRDVGNRDLLKQAEWISNYLKTLPWNTMSISPIDLNIEAKKLRRQAKGGISE